MGENKNLQITEAIGWTAAYFGVMVLYTFLNITVWRKIAAGFSEWLNIATIIVCLFIFIRVLKRRGYIQNIFTNISVTGVWMAVGCSIVFWLLLDNCLDPMFARIFPTSEAVYQDSIQSLLKSPAASLIQVCILAPFAEEMLMRGFVLNGLKKTYGTGSALIVSSVLFALLHFNMVQTLSAVVCGLFLGLLYIRTNSVFCCIVAHAGYNLISYMGIVVGYLVQ